MSIDRFIEIYREAAKLNGGKEITSQRLADLGKCISKHISTFKDNPKFVSVRHHTIDTYNNKLRGLY